MLSILRTFWELIKETAIEFGDDHATKLSASLAYFTLFSIAPLLLVIIHVLGFFYKTKEAESRVLQQVSQFVGEQGTEQLEAVLNKMNSSNSSTLFGIIGIVVFVFSATSIFTEIKSSINYMWSVKSKPKRGWLKIITDRLLALMLIVGAGFLMMATLVINVIVDTVTGQLKQFSFLQHYLGDVNFLLVSVVNTSVLFVMVTFIFVVIFRVLPDAKMHWKDTLVGASFTGVLFLLGKFLIAWYLTSSKLITAYGAAASLIVLLSWIYYSTLIVYFGAEFTDVYARKCGRGVTIKKTAVFIVKRESGELPYMQTHTDEDIG